jgi:cytochrome c oxidase subunit 2
MNMTRVSALLLVLFLAASAWIIATPISGVLPEATNHAQEVDFIFKFMSVGAVAVFLIVEGFLLYFVLKYRRRSTDAEDAIGTNIHGNTRLEIIWSVLPALFVIVLTGMSFKVYTDIIRKPATSYVVNVTAAQYQWVCQHPKYNITEGNSCHLPLNQDVTINLHAVDVIHSFWVPEFRVKQDAVPGYPTHMYFKPTRAGSYHLICAELCGPGHAYMRENLYVLAPAAFAAWVKAQQAASSGPVGTVSFKTDIEHIFSNHCATCHIALKSGGLNLGAYSGLVAGGNVVPGAVFKAGDHAASVLWKITQPGGGWPGGARMPLGGPYLSSHEIQTIAAWIDQGAKNN